MTAPLTDLQDLAASETFTFIAHRPDTDAPVTVDCHAPYTAPVQAALETYFGEANRPNLTVEEDRAASRTFAAVVLRGLPGITNKGAPLDCTDPATVARIFDTAPWLVGEIVSEMMERVRFLAERRRRSSRTSNTSADSSAA